MRILLVVLLLAPAFAQQPDQQKPPAPAGQQTAPAGQQAAPAQQQAAPAAQQAAPATPANPAPATEPAFTGSVDFGYLWRTNFHGSLPEYRSLVDLRQGPQLFGFNLTIQPPKKRFFDRADLSLYNWGNQPYNTAHLDVRKSGMYDITADYRNIAYFAAEPSFANPFAPAGFNQQAFDTRNRTTSVDISILPGKHIAPYLGFYHNSFSGNGIDTWVLQSSDTFPVPLALRDAENNYRAGLRFEYTHWHVSLEQGGSTYKNDDQTTYQNAANPGNFTNPIFGQSLVLNGLNQNYGIRADQIYSRGLLTANPLPWINLYGQFMFSEPRSYVNYSSFAQGNFVELSSLLFYSGQSTIGSGLANAPHVSGNAGFEMRPFNRLRIVESWMTDRYHDAASPLVTEQLYISSATVNPFFTATTPLSPTVNYLDYAQVVNYNQNQVDVFFDATKFLTLRGGWRYVWGNATVLAGQLSQTGLLANGDLKRNVGLAGLTLHAFAQKLAVNVDYEGSSSDNIYFRTSLNNYNLARVRARYQATTSLSLAANFYVLNNQNPAPDIQYDFQSRNNSLSIFWTPNGGKRFTITGEYDRTTVRSNILYLLPPFLSQATSIYRDNEHVATSLVDVNLPGYGGLTPKLSFGGSMFIGSGSRTTRWYQPLARLSIPLQKHVYWNTEWQWYGYGEPLFYYEGFRTHILMTGVRLVR
jgi:hypothetical protein